VTTLRVHGIVILTPTKRRRRRMAKHTEDVCTECGRREKDMTWVTWYRNKDNTKGALLCRKHELIAVNNKVRESHG
jgi:hypothetical protein